MRFFITGDKHGNLEPIYSWIKRMDFNREDIGVIILGDAGICWRNDKIDMAAAIGYHEDKYNFHLYFIDGNHENFKILKSIPIAADGLGHLSTHIHYIPRGYCGKINNSNFTIAAMGGADSVDKELRTQGLNWWKEEQITKEDIQKLKGAAADYLLTHCCPKDVFDRHIIELATAPNINQDEIDHTSEERLEEMVAEMQFKHCYFGHHHIDKKLEDKYTCVYNDFIELI